MDKKEKEILEEVINTVAVLKERVEVLEKEVASLKNPEEPVSDSDEVIDIELEEMDLNVIGFDEEETPVAAPVQEERAVVEVVAPAEEAPVEEAPAEEAPVEEAPAEDAPVVETPVEEAPVEDAPVVEAPVEEVPVEATAAGEIPVEEEVPLFNEMSLFGDVVEPEVKHPRKSTKAVMDVLADKFAWKHDLPGTPVKDIKSAISLNDRVMFISSLFREDSMLYQDTMSRLNAMSGLKEAVKYIRETFPEWKMDSEMVYRFMMAVRRKLK